MYELSNHLGNVLTTVSDRKFGHKSGSLNDYYTADVVSASDYYPFGMEMPNRTYSSPTYRYGFNGKEKDNEAKGEGNQLDYGMRVSDPRLGRFLSVDPLTPKYPELTPYQFASNMPIAAVDLDGLEAKIAIAGKGSPLKKPYGPGGTDYTPSDIYAFKERADRLNKYGFGTAQVHNGKMIVQLFVEKTKSDGSILSVVTFAHAGPNGVYLDNDGGFYSSGIDKKNTVNDANINEIAALVKTGEIKFEKNAVWVFAGCNCGNPNGNPKMGSANLAQNTAETLGITTIGATGAVEPEFTKDGKHETGRLTTKGTFIQYSKQHIVVEWTSMEDRTFLGIKIGEKTVKHKWERDVLIKKDLGKTIDINSLTPPAKKP